MHVYILGPGNGEAQILGAKGQAWGTFISDRNRISLARCQVVAWSVVVLPAIVVKFGLTEKTAVADTREGRVTPADAPA